MKSFLLLETCIGPDGTPRFPKFGRPLESGNFSQEELTLGWGSHGTPAPGQPAGSRALPSHAGAHLSPVWSRHSNCRRRWGQRASWALRPCVCCRAVCCKSLKGTGKSFKLLPSSLLRTRAVPLMHRPRLKAFTHLTSLWAAQESRPHGEMGGRPKGAAVSLVRASPGPEVVLTCCMNLGSWELFIRPSTHHFMTCN